MRLKTVVKFAIAYLAGLVTVALPVLILLNLAPARPLRATFMDHVRLLSGGSFGHYSYDAGGPFVAEMPILELLGDGTTPTPGQVFAIAPFTPQLPVTPADVRDLCVDYGPADDITVIKLVFSDTFTEQLNNLARNYPGPDGQTLPFAVVDPEGQNRLWIRGRPDAADGDTAPVAPLEFELRFPGRDLFQSLDLLLRLRGDRQIRPCTADPAQYEALRDLLWYAAFSYDGVDKVLAHPSPQAGSTKDR